MGPCYVYRFEKMVSMVDENHVLWYLKKYQFPRFEKGGNPCQLRRNFRHERGRDGSLNFWNCTRGMARASRMISPKSTSTSRGTLISLLRSRTWKRDTYGGFCSSCARKPDSGRGDHVFVLPLRGPDSILRAGPHFLLTKKLKGATICGLSYISYPKQRERIVMRGRNPTLTPSERIVEHLCTMPPNGRHPVMRDNIALLKLMEDPSNFSLLDLSTQKAAHRLAKCVKRHIEEWDRAEALIQAVSPDGTGLPEHREALVSLARDEAFCRGLPWHLGFELFHRAFMITRPLSVPPSAIAHVA